MFRRIILGCLVLPLWVFGHGDVTVATQEALQAALDGGGLVRILTSDPIIITNSITISATTTIEGSPRGIISGGGSNRIFTVSGGVTFRAVNVTFADGVERAGTITPTGENAHMLPSQGVSAFGGAIRGEGSRIELVNCIFLRNQAWGGAGFDGSRVSGATGGGAFGGALYLANCQTYMTNCHFSENLSASGVYEGRLNEGLHPPAAGGAFAVSGGSVICHGVQVHNNYVWTGGWSFSGGPGYGGGAYFSNAVFRIVDSSFSANSITHQFGNVLSEGLALWVSGAGSIEISSFSDNRGSDVVPILLHGGGIYFSGNLNITNTTVTGNRATIGGGIFGNGGDLTLTHCTIANNKLFETNTAGANIATTNQTAVAARSTILAGPANLQNSTATIQDLGFNISSDSSAGFLTSLSYTDPKLEKLSIASSNGTISILPNLSSPAVDAIPLSEAPSVDQLGFPRVGGKADIGAREVGPNVLQWQHSAGFMAGWFGTSAGIECTDLIWPLGNNVSIGSDWKVVQTGDYNRDGTSDLLWRSSSGQLGVWPIANLGLKMQGTASVMQAPLVGWEWRVVGWRDLDGDNDFDLWWQGPGGVQGIWWMNGNAFSSGVILTNLPLPGNDWQVVKLADFNGDNAVDLLWQSQSSGALGIWHLDAQRRLVGTPGMFLNTHDPVLLHVGPDWKLVSVIDYDMDGIHDLIWQHNGNGMVAWWGLDDQRRPVASKMKLISDLVPGKDWRLINVITP